MPDYRLGQVIAERQLQLRVGDELQPACVRIGLPYFAAEHEAWQCPYEVDVCGTKRTFAVWGEDSLQALVLTLKILDIELDVRAKQAGGTLLWLGGLHASVMEPAADPKRQGNDEPGT